MRGKRTTYRQERHTKSEGASRRFPAHRPVGALKSLSLRGGVGEVRLAPGRQKWPRATAGRAQGFRGALSKGDTP